MTHKNACLCQVSTAFKIQPYPAPFISHNIFLSSEQLPSAHSITGAEDVQPFLNTKQNTSLLYCLGPVWGNCFWDYYSVFK